MTPTKPTSRSECEEMLALSTTPDLCGGLTATGRQLVTGDLPTLVKAYQQAMDDIAHILRCSGTAYDCDDCRDAFNHERNYHGWNGEKKP